MKHAVSNKRRTFLIDPQFQIRVALWGSLWMILEVLIAAGTVMVIALTSVWIPAGFHISFFYKLASALAIVVLLVTLMNIGGAVYFAHRISGPLYRIKQSLRKVGEGDLSVLINLRENDELQELKDEFNEMVNNLRERVVSVEAGLKEDAAKPGKRGKPAAKFHASKLLRQAFKL